MILRLPPSDRGDPRVDFYKLRLLTYNYGSISQNKNNFSRGYFEIQVSHDSQNERITRD